MINYKFNNKKAVEVILSHDSHIQYSKLFQYDNRKKIKKSDKRGKLLKETINKLKI
jgi:hypothetical protein